MRRNSYSALPSAKPANDNDQVYRAHPQRSLWRPNGRERRGARRRAVVPLMLNLARTLKREQGSPRVACA